MGVGIQVTLFHIRYTLLCYLGHPCVPSCECANLIWKVHYSWVAGKFNVEKTILILQKYFYWKKLQHGVNRYIKLGHC
jgi:hypothetical protein